MKNGLEFELAHIGLNLENDENALAAAETFASLFGLDIRKGKKSYFSGKYFECIRIPFRGEKGHIALHVNDMERALKSFEERGIAVDIDESTEYDANGKIVNVYLHDPIGGFAIHLMQK